MVKTLRSDGLYIDYENTVHDEYPNLKTVIENRKHKKCNNVILKQENIIYHHMHKVCLTDAYIKQNGGRSCSANATYPYYCYECKENLFVTETYIDDSLGE